jgi:carboxyl-terminal processing protease
LVERKVVSRIGIPLAFCLFFLGCQTYLTAKEKTNDAEIIVADGGSPTPKLIAQLQRSPHVTPQSTYNRAFKLIKDQYYDQTFSGQDWNRWERRYNGKLKTSDESHKAIETMLASLGDPYTRFLDVDAFKDEKDQIEAHLYGVGMQLGMSPDHKVVVIAPIQDTPAYKAGMQPGDEITEVNHKIIKGQSLDQVVKQIRGPINTTVAITFLRKGPKKDEVSRKEVNLKRAEIPIQAVVTQEILPGNIGYIRLDSFISNKAEKEMKDALQKLDKADGLILDLRNNPGGLLTNAIEIAKMFLNRGIIVSTIDADKYKQSQLQTGEAFYTKPLVVIINHGSASASEILSGALRDNGRAELVGEKSFGKGLVQAINRLDDESGINVTIARYLTPNDTDIHKTGIIPDYKVELKADDYENNRGPWWVDLKMSNFKRSAADNNDLQLKKAIEVMKKKLAGENKTPATTASK